MTKKTNNKPRLYRVMQLLLRTHWVMSSAPCGRIERKLLVHNDVVKGNSCESEVKACFSHSLGRVSDIF